jgi:diapolycopene oxygenase
MKKRIAVVGSGLGGLAAAGRLAAAGFEVDVFEKQGFPGGKAGSETIGGYRFDTGPSLLTMPFVFDEWFKALGFSRTERLEFVPLNPITSYFFADGTRFKSYSGRERLLEEIRDATAEDPLRVSAYLDRSARIYDSAAEIFLFNSLHESSTYRSKTFLRSLPRLPFIHGLDTMDRLNRRSFRDPHLVQLFNRYATYNGSSPYKTPGTMTLIPHVEYNLGAFGVGGGIVAIPRSMHAAAAERGVRFHFDTPVDEILLTGNRVSGIRAGGETRAFDGVVSNADVLTTYGSLLKMPDDPASRRYRRLEPSSSGIVFYWGIDGSFPELGLHNIFFSSDYAEEFRALFDEGRVGADPTIYLNITSKITPEDAPRGGENWFILVNAPAAKGQDWNEIMARTRERVISTLSRRLDRNIGTLIRAEGTLSPPEIEERTSSSFGSLYGIASNSISAAFSRHPNRSRRIPGLYFTGGSAHPGGGMPLALLSGRIASDLIQRYEGGT